MKMNWNDTTIKHFKEASEYTNFHENLANYIKPFLNDCNSLCDIGCGLALIDVYLSESVDDITCLDIDEKVIDFVENNIREKNIKNIKCKVDDYKKLDGFWDTILISFFGFEEIEFFSNYCKKLIAVINDKTNSHIPLSDNNREFFSKNNAEKLAATLNNRNINYSLHKVSMEFGQTFSNKKNIELYAKSYSDNDDYNKIYNHIMDNITEGEDIAYYLPYKKSLSVFVINFS